MSGAGPWFISSASGCLDQCYEPPGSAKFEESLCSPDGKPLYCSYRRFRSSIMDIFFRDLLAKIQNGESGLEKAGPPKVTGLIKGAQALCQSNPNSSGTPPSLS